MVVTGVRDLKNRLSHYLRLVVRGEVVLVTDRGTVVARLGPPGDVMTRGDLPEEDALERLARTGRLRRGTGRIASATAEPLPRPGRRIDLDAAVSDARSDGT
jgi:prevent-host-death family protein